MLYWPLEVDEERIILKSTSQFILLLLYFIKDAENEYKQIINHFYCLEMKNKKIS
jgi:hypothetical protein